MTGLIETIARDGLAFVFLNVLVQQLGVPIPAQPTLLVAGSLAASGRLPLAGVVGATLAAVLLADSTWFFIGRRYGSSALRVICRVSLSPDSCVRETEQRFTRWGLKSIAIAKFIPGFSMVAPPLAGAMHARVSTFLVYDLIAGILWSSVGIGLGLLFSAQVEEALVALASLGAWAVLGGVVAIALFVTFKWWQRHRFFRKLRMARISVEDLKRLIDSGSAPIILDVRTSAALLRDPQRIPGAIAFTASSVASAVAELPRDREIVLYCNCPNEASAARVARMLMDRGFHLVRPLTGGLEAWLDAGFEPARESTSSTTG